MLSLILYLNAACHNLTEENATLTPEIFSGNFPLPNKFVEGGVLTICNGGLAMEGVATVHMKVLMFVRGFSVEVCTNLAILKVDHCVQNVTCSADQVAVSLRVARWQKCHLAP